MVRKNNTREESPVSSPHVRGDGPHVCNDASRQSKFSPRAWGWSGNRSIASRLALVLPTCVGMVRLESIHRPPETRSPHVRGDGPFVDHSWSARCGFSPRAWGWSGLGSCPTGPGGVLPTCVGMVPTSASKSLLRARFSPRAWGWSLNCKTSEKPVPVLPTCVGMVRTLALFLASQWGSPHVRGDGPGERLRAPS